MEHLVFKRPRKTNQFGTFPLAAAGALLMQIPSAVYQAAIALAAVPFGFLLAKGWSTTVTADGIAVRAVRRRFIPWEQVDAITVDESGDRSIDLSLNDGSHRRLPAPVERQRRSHGDRFDEKYAAIVTAWLRSSGPGDDDCGPGRKRGGAGGPVSPRRPGVPSR